MRSKTAVLLMAYGSAPSTAEPDVRAYLDHILQHYRNVSATDEQVRDLRARYEAIGGSPLFTITNRLARKVAKALRTRDVRAKVHVAMKHSPPFIADVVNEIARSKVTGAVGFALAPFRSRLTSDAYYEAVRTAGADTNVDWRFPDDWHLHPGFIAVWERLIREAAADADPVVVFTNHSLPARILSWNDPYPEQFAALAGILAQRLGLERWGMAFQSAGGGGQPWLGPSLFEVVGEWIGRGESDFVIAPIGFLMDHLEVLYDLDVEATRMATELDVSLRRTAMPNADDDFVELLADVVRQSVVGNK